MKFKAVLTVSSIVLLAAVGYGCSQTPTARLYVDIQLADCTAQFETALYNNSQPILTRQDLHNYNNETESNIGCGIDEIEYGFHTLNEEQTSKIEFDVNEGEVTAFISLNPEKTSVEPFVMGDDVDFRQVTVKVVSPSNEVIAEGYAKHGQ